MALISSYGIGVAFKDAKEGDDQMIWFRASGTCRDDYCEVVISLSHALYNGKPIVSLRRRSGSFPSERERNERRMLDTPQNRVTLATIAAELVASVEEDYGVRFDYAATRRKFWSTGS